MKIYRFFTLPFLVLTILSCNKDHLSYDDLYKKATDKYQEMHLLTQSISCGDISKWYIDTLLLDPNTRDNTLYFHLTQLDKELQNCGTNNSPTPKSIRCENNKPILVF